MYKIIKPIIALLTAATLTCTAGAIDVSTIEQAQEVKNTAHEMAECARRLGLAEDHPVIKTASGIWWEAHDAEKALKDGEIQEGQNDTGLSYTTPEQWAQYPVASAMYEYFRGTMGLSPAVSAGLIGGYMEESGGQTLSINPYIYAGSGSYSYYGFAMWSLLYCPEVSSMTLDQQLGYLNNTLKKNIEYFGGSYDYFCSLGDPGAVVQYYYKFYGRGYGSASRQRVKNGYTAYDYFGGV